jgi:hypothetical protein
MFPHANANPNNIPMQNLTKVNPSPTPKRKKAITKNA